MSDLTRMAENEVWYRRPAKRRAARVVYDDHRGTPTPEVENRGAGGVTVAAGGVAVDRNPRSPGNRRTREGHGEG
jgi:hypothetical protein